MLDGLACVLRALDVSLENASTAGRDSNTLNAHKENSWSCDFLVLATGSRENTILS